MKLSILIPTYNRCNDLRKNLELLCKYIKDDQLESEVCICVSDNASTDDTEQKVKEGKLVYLDVCDIEIDIWKQLIYHKNKWLSSSMKAFLEYVKDNEFTS